jgi:hypothetical protein
MQAVVVEQHMTEEPLEQVGLEVAVTAQLQIPMAIMEQLT